jgi:hypothetical protein
VTNLEIQTKACLKYYILPLPCGDLFALMKYIDNNPDHFETNSIICSVNTSNKGYNFFTTVLSLLALESSTIVLLISEA